MLTNKLELKRDEAVKVLLTWHKRDEAGQTIPLAIEYLDDLDPQLKADVERLALHPVYAIVDGTRKQVPPGSSAHFLALPKLLGRLGFRTRLY